MKEYPLNITGKEFCNRIGIAYNGDILKCLRELDLVEFFNVGKRHKYSAEDVEKVSNLLRRGNISIKTVDGCYYITLNDI